MELCHSFGVHSGPFVAPPGAIEYEASPGAVEAHPRTLKAYTGAINGTSGALELIGGLGGGSLWSHEGSPLPLEVHP